MTENISKYFDKNHFRITFLLILFGTIIRFLGISIIPGGLNQDEASIGYEAFSLLYDGADRNGVKYPVHFISWGSGQNALYAYLSMPVIKFFGLNLFSIRFINALFSSLSLLLFYYLFKLAFSKKVALFSLSFLVICPWSIMSARWGLEANIFPVLFLSGTLFLFKAIKEKQRYYIIASFCFALSLYSYGTSYLVIPLFFLQIACYLIYFQKISIKYAIGSFLLFLLIALPIILFVFINHFDFPQMELWGLTIPRMPENRTIVIFNLFSSDFPLNLLKNTIRFSSIFFLQTDNLFYNAVPAFGLIYHISLPFFFIGLFNILRSKNKCFEPINFIMLAWFISSFILGITANININRINIILFPTTYFTLLGLLYIKDFFREEYQYGLKKFLFLFYSISFLLFAGYYVSFFNKEYKKYFCYGLGEAIEYVNDKYPTATINVTTHSINMPYIYVCFYEQTPPNFFRETVIYDENSEAAFKKVLAFGRYKFKAYDKLDENEVTIVSDDEFSFSNNLKDREYKRFGNYYVISTIEQSL